jgi:hypothetical protein
MGDADDQPMAERMENEKRAYRRLRESRERKRDD